MRIRVWNATISVVNARTILKRLVLKAINAYFLQLRSSRKGLTSVGNSIRPGSNIIGPLPLPGMNLTHFSERVLGINYIYEQYLEQDQTILLIPTKRSIGLFFLTKIPLIYFGGVGHKVCLNKRHLVSIFL